MGRDVEEVAAALVREFLSRKGLKKTIACMDQELPRTSVSISNRSELCRVLHLEGLYKKSKSEEEPLKSMLEILARERMTKSHPRATGRRSPDPEERVRELTETHAETPRSSLHLLPLRRSSSALPPENRDNVPASATSPDQVEWGLERSRPEVESQTGRGSCRARRGFVTGLITASNQETGRRRPTRRPAARFSLPDQNQDDPSRSGGGNSTPAHSDLRLVPAGCESDVSGSRTGTPKEEPAGGPGATGDHMVLDDVDDEDVRGSSAVPLINNALRRSHLNRHPMDQQTAAALKEILFGSSMRCFSVEWRCQSLSFSDNPDLSYGIVQKKGGPCGALAVVQATLLQKLLFEGGRGEATSERLRVSGAARTACLLEAVVEILWRTGERRRATVAVHSGRKQFSPTGHYRADGVLEMITLIDVDTLEDLKQTVKQYIHQLESGPCGCVLLVVSALASRTPRTVRDDMDHQTSTLIGAHGYCAQELVNLLLSGRAVSNVFDDEVKVDSGGGDAVLLKGLKERCDVGLLSLYEHYRLCEVGSYLKQPRFPIWVVCSESHFSVLFSLGGDLTSALWNPQPFDLFYYDGLANQQEPIRLSVYPDQATEHTGDDASDLTPPLELCIRTRWTGAAVSWNQSEPIL